MTSQQTDLRIETGTQKDIPVILNLIKSLAKYERLADEVTATEEDLRESLFGKHPAAEVLLAFVGTEAIGFAVFYTSYSTFLGKSGLYLEDIFVTPKWRKRGFGRQLLAHVAKIAAQRRCGRMEWSVLDWNEPAIRFYENLGAEAMDQWRVYRLTGKALQTLGKGIKRK